MLSDIGPEIGISIGASISTFVSFLLCLCSPFIVKMKQHKHRKRPNLLFTLDSYSTRNKDDLRLPSVKRN